MCAAISIVDPTLTLEKLQYSKENQYFERKNSRVSNKEVAIQISAMANASGGTIAIGIEDDGKIVGISEAQENTLRQVPIDFLQVIPKHEVEIVTTAAGVGKTFNVVKDITLERPLHRLLTEGKQLISSQMREFQQLGLDGKLFIISPILTTVRPNNF